MIFMFKSLQARIIIRSVTQRDKAKNMIKYEIQSSKLYDDAFHSIIITSI